eukprot:tig00020685_g12945.t1
MEDPGYVMEQLIDPAMMATIQLDAMAIVPEAAEPDRQGLPPMYAQETDAGGPVVGAHARNLQYLRSLSLQRREAEAARAAKQQRAEAYRAKLRAQILEEATRRREQYAGQESPGPDEAAHPEEPRAVMRGRSSSMPSPPRLMPMAGVAEEPASTSPSNAEEERKKREAKQEAARRQEEYLRMLAAKKEEERKKAERNERRAERMRESVRQAVLSVCAKLKESKSAAWKREVEAAQRQLQGGPEADVEAWRARQKEAAQPASIPEGEEGEEAGDGPGPPSPGPAPPPPPGPSNGSPRKAEGRKKLPRAITFNGETVPGGSPYAQTAAAVQHAQIVSKARALRKSGAAEEIELAIWRKRNGIGESTKVFIITGCYPDVRRSLLARGWFENTDQESPWFDLKWALRGKEIDHKNLKRNQIVNHFSKNTEVTTKVGLARNLRNLQWFENVDIETFFPRCYDLHDPGDRQDWIDDFRCLAAECLLKRYDAAGPQSSLEPHFVGLALKAARRRLKESSEFVDEGDIQAQDRVWSLTRQEWEALVAYSTWLAKGKKEAPPKLPPGKLLEMPGVEEVRAALAELRAREPQFSMDGSRNIWIVKPAGKSRGRGIQCVNDMHAVLELTGEGKENQWVVQKYIENPLCIQRKKFDIRQWVLVTDWNPLTVWFYGECYLRFSTEDFSLEDVSDKFVHLTNNSIQKYSERFDASEIEGNMWEMATFVQHLAAVYGSEDVWHKNVYPQMKRVAAWALTSAQDSIENRKNTCELFGYDFMIDEELRVWLIEINSSPSMEHSSPVTARLCSECIEDTMKIMVDSAEKIFARNRPRRPSTGPGEDDPHDEYQDLDTGKWRCVYKSPIQYTLPTAAFGTSASLFVKGTGMGKPKASSGQPSAAQAAIPVMNIP